MNTKKTTIATLAALGLVLVSMAPAAMADEHDGADALLWTQGGENSSWDFNGESYATNHDGEYNGSECAYIESPPLPLALSTEVTLEHSFDYEHSSFSGTAWDGGVLLVSTDLGVSWQYLDLDAYTSAGSFSGVNNCVDELTGEDGSGRNAFSGFGSEVSTTVDLADHDLGPTDIVQVRFVSASDSIVNYPGWTIDDVTIGGIPAFIA